MPPPTRLRKRLNKKTEKEYAKIAVIDSKRNLERIENVMNADDLLRIIEYVKDMSEVSENHPVVSYISRLAHAMQKVLVKDEDESGAATASVPGPAQSTRGLEADRERAPGVDVPQL